MPPTDTCFPSPLEIFQKLRSIVQPEDLTDEESDTEDTLSNMEDFETSSEGELQIGEEMTDDEIDHLNYNETPVTTLRDEQNKNYLTQRLVFSARRLFPSDTDESDVEMQYLDDTDDDD